ncbi:MAG: hypothetical protein HUK24_00315 [Sphaerochaetaceae bacterium]|nr:hypothetical protein [Sphaerochaetaceae bacterium]
MYCRKNEELLKEAKDLWQLDWNSSGLGNDMFLFLGSFEKNIRFFNGSLLFNGFVQKAFDLLLGGGCTIGFNCSYTTKIGTLTYSNTIGGKGPRIGSIGEVENPTNKTTVAFESKNSNLHLTYNDTVYKAPIYGGNSQRKTIEYTTKFIFSPLSFIISHNTLYEKDFGRTSFSLYNLKLSQTKIYSVPVSFDTGITFNRIVDSVGQWNNGYISISFPNGTFYSKGNKYNINLSYSWKLEDVTLKMSLTQDRVFTITLKNI